MLFWGCGLQFRLMGHKSDPQLKICKWGLYMDIRRHLAHHLVLLPLCFYSVLCDFCDIFLSFYLLFRDIISLLGLYYSLQCFGNPCGLQEKWPPTRLQHQA